MNSPADHLNRAIAILGGLQPATSALELNTYQTLQQWRRKRVPADYCPRIEKATGGAVRCEELRPDVEWAVVRGAPCDCNQSEAA